MSNPVLQEASTVSVLEASEAFFQNRPTDTRFENVSIVKYQTTAAALGADMVEFSLPAQTTNLFYMWQEHTLEVHLRMVKKSDSSALPDDMIACPANNIVDTLFENVAIHLGNSVINKNPGRYPYRAYISKLLSYPSQAKMTWMQSEGWYEEKLAHFDPSTYQAANHGVKQRRELFMDRVENEGSAIHYNTNYIPMFGRIYSDLNTMNTGILPGISMNITMQFANDKFRINVNKSDADIKIEVNKVVLHVPLAALNPNIYKSIEAKLAKDACKIFYKRCEFSHYTINKNSQSFTQIINSSTGSGASRMLIFFLTLTQFEGRFERNPFQFCRRWTDDSSAGHEKSSWVQKVDILLNGKSLDCLNGDALPHDDQISFLRLNQIFGNIGQTTSNSITYRKWCDNAAIFAFDLTVSGRSSQVSDILSPIVQTGDTRLDIVFGGSPSLTEMKVCILSEYPSLLTINKSRSLNFSYYSASL